MSYYALADTSVWYLGYAWASQKRRIFFRGMPVSSSRGEYKPLQSKIITRVDLTAIDLSSYSASSSEVRSGQVLKDPERPCPLKYVGNDSHL